MNEFVQRLKTVMHVTQDDERNTITINGLEFNRQLFVDLCTLKKNECYLLKCDGNGGITVSRTQL